MAKVQPNPYPLRMEKGLRDQLQELASAQGLSLNELINQLLSSAVGSPHPIKQIQDELAELKRTQHEILELIKKEVPH